MAVSSGNDEKRHITGASVRGQALHRRNSHMSDVYVWQELQGQSVDEIVAQFPELTHADVYAAMAYFWDHRDQIMACSSRRGCGAGQVAVVRPSLGRVEGHGIIDDGLAIPSG